MANNRNRDNYNDDYNRRKRSGCTSGIGKNGEKYVRGWKASKRKGLVVYLCTPYKDTKVHESKSGRKWENWVCKVQPESAQSYLISCLYDVMNNKVIINEIGYVLNPKGGRGGYCGRFSR